MWFVQGFEEFWKHIGFVHFGWGSSMVTGALGRTRTHENPQGCANTGCLPGTLNMHHKLPSWHNKHTWCGGELASLQVWWVYTSLGYSITLKYYDRFVIKQIAASVMSVWLRKWSGPKKCPLSLLAQPDVVLFLTHFQQMMRELANSYSASNNNNNNNHNNNNNIYI